MSYKDLPEDLAQWTIQALTRLAGTSCVAQGILVITGGRERWAGPAYATALQVPAAPESWGWVLLLSGVGIMIGTFVGAFRATALVLGVVGLWCLFFAGSFLYTVARGPRTVGSTGIVTYGWLAVTAFVLAVAYDRAGAIRASKRRATQ